MAAQQQHQHLQNLRYLAVLQPSQVELRGEVVQHLEEAQAREHSRRVPVEVRCAKELDVVLQEVVLGKAKPASQDEDHHDPLPKDSDPLPRR